MKLKYLFLIPILIIVIPVLTLFLIDGYIKLSTRSNIISKEEAYNIKADCVLVLGAGVIANSTPSPILKDRLNTSIDLYNNGLTKKILMSGDHRENDYNEVGVMKNYVTSNGVASVDIFLDHQGLSTYESIYRAKEKFGVKKMIIVTQTYHLYRALYIAKKLGIEAYGVTSSTDEKMISKETKKREFLARLKDFWITNTEIEEDSVGDKVDITGNGDSTN